MKRTFLKFLYKRYRRELMRMFVDEFFEELPRETVEPAMQFLANGRDRLEKWGFFWVRALQKRMVTNPTQIEFYEGMLTMSKLLLAQVEFVRPKTQVPSQEKGKDVRDDVKEAEGAIAELKKISTRA